MRSTFFPFAIAVAVIGASLGGCTVNHPTSDQVSLWNKACNYAKPVEVRKTVNDVPEYLYSIIFQDVDINTGQVLTERIAPSYRCMWTTGKLYACALTDREYHPRYEKRLTTKYLYVDPKISTEHQVVRETKILDRQTGEVFAVGANAAIYSDSLYLGYLTSVSHRSCGGELADDDVFKHTRN
jgi:hypothetical protein